MWQPSACNACDRCWEPAKTSRVPMPPVRRVPAVAVTGRCRAEPCAAGLVHKVSPLPFSPAVWPARVCTAVWPARVCPAVWPARACVEHCGARPNFPLKVVGRFRPGAGVRARCPASERAWGAAVPCGCGWTLPLVLFRRADKLPRCRGRGSAARRTGSRSLAGEPFVRAVLARSDTQPTCRLKARNEPMIAGKPNQNKCTAHNFLS